MAIQHTIQLRRIVCCERATVAVCVCRQCLCTVCVCIAANCCGRAQARSLVVQNGAQGPVSEQRMMTDLLVRLFCHTHTCHNLPRLDCAALRCSGAVAVAVGGSLRLFFLLLLPCVCFSTLFAQRRRRRRRRVRSVRSFEIYLALAKRRRLIGSPLSRCCCQRRRRRLCVR